MTLPHKLFIAGWLGGLLFLACCLPQGSAQRPLESETASGSPGYRPEVALDSVRDSLTSHFRLRSVGGAPVFAIARRAEAQWKRLAALLGPGFRLTSKPQLIVYPNVEAKGLLTRNTQVAHLDPETNAVHRIAGPAFASHEDEALLTLLVRQHLGTPEHAALEKGLAVSLTRTWQKRGYRYWAMRLLRSGNAMPPAELLDEALFAKESELVKSCLAGLWVAFLREELGEERFLKAYRKFSPGPAERARLEQRWEAWLARQKGAAPLVIKKQRPESLGSMRGFNFTHEGYNIYNGYSGNRAAQSLDNLTALGANAVALVPYSYMRDAQKPSFLPFMKDHPGTEHDEGLIHCAQLARERSMFVLLKPQVWFGHRSWPGDLEMQSEEDWQAFFQYYHRWIRHYALLAAIHEMDALCVGVEFVKATVQRPEDWRRLIRKVRGIYPGTITYAANWGEEFRKLRFADELDIVGLNCYYPLGYEDEMSLSELQAGFAGHLRKIDKQAREWGTPVWFTEIGFPSLDMPWKQPHAEPGDRSSNPEHQARCYEATLRAMEAFSRPMGQFWWKWSADPEGPSLHDREFGPTRKPAEAVLRRMWKE